VAFEESQGTRVIWDGVDVVAMATVSVQAGAVSGVDITAITANVLGSGNQARVLKSVVPATVETATVTVVCRGVGIPVLQTDRGKQANLRVEGTWGWFEGNAYLKRSDLTMATGDLVAQTVEWEFTA
jgi:hypothetical protein